MKPYKLPPPKNYKLQVPVPVMAPRFPPPSYAIYVFSKREKKKLFFSPPLFLLRGNPHCMEKQNPFIIIFFSFTPLSSLTILKKNMNKLTMRSCLCRHLPSQFMRAHERGRVPFASLDREVKARVWFSLLEGLFFPSLGSNET